MMIMIEMIKYWLTGCVAFIGNTAYENAKKELENKVVAFLLGLVLTIVPGFWTLGQMYPIRSFGRLIWLCFWILVEFAVCFYFVDSMETSLLKAVAKKCEASSRLYAARKSEKAEARLAGMTVIRYREAKKRAEQERAARQRAEWERARRKKAEWEKAQREQAKQERTRRERAEQEKAQRERAEREKAQRERAQREKAKQNSPVQRARQLLRLREAYTMPELKKARNTLIKEFHPDNKVSGNEEMCKKINEAYDLLAKYAKTA